MLTFYLIILKKVFFALASTGQFKGFGKLYPAPTPVLKDVTTSSAKSKVQVRTVEAVLGFKTGGQ